MPHIRKRVSPAPMRIPSSANTAPLSGSSAANSHQISCACATTAASWVNSASSEVSRRRRARARRPRRARRTRGSCGRPPRARRRRRPRRGSARRAPARRSRAHRARARGRRRAGTRSGGRRATRRRPVRARRDATRKAPSSAAVRTAISSPMRMSRRMRARTGRCQPALRLDGEERRAHARLGDDGAPGRAREPPAEAVDEQDLEDDVHDVGDDEDDQRGPEVARPAQVALAGAREHERGCRDRGDAQVRDGAVGHLALPAHERHERRRCDLDDADQHDADREREPLGLRADVRGLVHLARAVQPRDLRGGPVGEEVEDRERRREHRRRDRERGELRRAQVADDRGVHEHVERLGRERAERRDRQQADLAVVAGAAEHSAP